MSACYADVEWALITAGGIWGEHHAVFLFDINVFFCFQEIKYLKQVRGDEAGVEPVQKKGECERKL